MLLSWLDAREAKEFGVSLARFYIQHVSHGASDRKHTRKSKDAEIMGKMGLQIDRFRQVHKMNFYKKAQFGTAFKWTLEEAGYEKEVADELTRLLLIRLR